ncbi:hypothetical protein [Parvularcula sp. IMCC14364]|uniref:hypothetical protein n=1 Tax=Parvularcula sp. IMCC14364 TaxID=3067902 RepID=UPI002741926B|nr:hypothetical protein [Parvularcula sp. IMCC14364]
MADKILLQNSTFVKSGLKVLLLAGLALGISACVTTEDRYSRLYDACDARANVCFSQCSGYSLSQGRDQCQRDCAVEADRCFADISALAASESAYYASRSSFYGRYGAWYPGRGYQYGPHGYPYGYGRYGYGGYSRGGYSNNDNGRPSDNSSEYPLTETRRSDGKPNVQRQKPLPGSGGTRPSAAPSRPTGKPNTGKPALPPKTPKPAPPVKPSTPKPATPKPSGQRKPIKEIERD